MHHGLAGREAALNPSLPLHAYLLVALGSGLGGAARLLDEREVPRVEGAHRRDEGDVTTRERRAQALRLAIGAGHAFVAGRADRGAHAVPPQSTSVSVPFLAPSVVWRKRVSPRIGPREVLSEPTMTSVFTNSPVRK